MTKKALPPRRLRSGWSRRRKWVVIHIATDAPAVAVGRCGCGAATFNEPKVWRCRESERTRAAATQTNPRFAGFRAVWTLYCRKRTRRGDTAGRRWSAAATQMLGSE